MTVNDRIGAVHILQRFVMMSRTLLPKLMDLMSKDKLSADEAKRMQQIKDVYDTFNANPQMSVVLINSGIFQLIKEVYNLCKQQSLQKPEDSPIYNAFLKESDRLIEMWNKQVLN